MEETLNMEKQELNCSDPEESEGGIHRRLRDRALLRKRKAEAEEKETDQWVYGLDSKRRRGESGRGRRGRPRKTENIPEILPFQEESAQVPQAPLPQEVVPEPGKASPAEASSSPAPLLPVGQDPLESQLAYIPEALVPLPAGASIQAPILSSSSTFYISPATAPILALTLAPDVVPEPVSATITAPLSTLIQSTPSLAPLAQCQTTTQSEAPDFAQSLAPATTSTSSLVIIEDLGPDMQEDIASSPKKVADERFDIDLIEEPSLPMTEQNNTISSLPLTSQSSPQEYFQGN